MLKRVETCWVSIIELLRRLLSKFRTLIYSMMADLEENNKAKFNFLSFCSLLVLGLGSFVFADFVLSFGLPSLHLSKFAMLICFIFCSLD